MDQQRNGTWKKASLFLHSDQRMGATIAFLVAFALLFMFAHASWRLGFRGDALETWRVAKTYWDGASHPRADVEYRGFLFFTINFLIYKLSIWLGTSQYLTLRFFTSLLFAALSAISIPNLISRVSGQPATFLRRLLCIAIVFYFFRGHFLYPSTDTVSLWCTIMALNAALGTAQSGLRGAFLTGLWASCAMLLRGNFILSVPFILLIAFRGAGIRFEKPSGRTLLRVAAMAAPIILLIGFNNWNQVERTILYGPAPATNSNVFDGQLSRGLRVQRIEWRTGGSFPTQPTWIEPAGLEIIKEEALGEWVDKRQYAELMARHPAAFAGLFARHLFNGLDIAYPTAYVPDVTQRSWLFALANYLLLFWGIALVVSHLGKKDRRFTNACVLLALFLPALACMPFEVEPRFFMSLGLPLLAWPAVAGRFDQLRPRMLITAAVFVLACFAVSFHIFATLDGPVPLPFHTFP